MKVVSVLFRLFYDCKYVNVLMDSYDERQVICIQRCDLVVIFLVDQFIIVCLLVFYFQMVCFFGYGVIS